MKIIKVLYALLCSAIWIAASPILAQSETSEVKAKVFRFHSGLEPAAVDPAALNDATGGFLFFNLYRSLYRLDKKNVPAPELAEKCTWMDKEKLRLLCRLKPNLKFSNGEPITAEHWVRAWRRLVDPKTGSRHSELLLPLVNAQRIVEGQVANEQLGIKALDDRTLEIQLQHADSEFLYKISSPVLTPLFNNPPTNPEQFATMISTGPYRLVEWQKKTRVRLEPNPHYPIQNQRPNVEVLMIEEDSTALQMFDLGKLDFLRRLNIKEIPWRKTRKEFLYIPTYRFDYIGFGPELNDYPEVRKALALSLNYPELSKAYLTPGKIGCPSLPSKLSSPWPCLHLNLKAAKTAWAKAQTLFTKPLVLTYSRSGGEDVGRGMEWMQSQWKKGLGLNVTLRPLESGMYFQEIKTSPPMLFRKGTNLDRPTCLSALEAFTSSSPDNNLNFRDPLFDKLVEQMRNSSNALNKKKWCGQGLKILIEGHRLIPLGELYFAMLAKPDFGGWRVTPLNQLDLTDLKVVRP